MSGTWERELSELELRRQAAAGMGGAEKVGLQKAKGKLPVRERLATLLDDGSFREVGTLSGSAQYGVEGELLEFAPSNFIIGRGRIDGRPVAVAADDFTVRGGAADAAITEKHVQSEQMANELRLPLVRLIDGAGGSVKVIESAGYTYVPANPAWNWVVDNLATAPVVALGLGPVAGLNAARLVTSHYSVLVKEIGMMFAAGPAVVTGAGGGEVSKEELGSPAMHARSGAVDDIAESEADAFAKARSFLSYLPTSVYELPPRASCDDPADRAEAWLDEAIPRSRRRPYKIRPIIEALFDLGSFFEIGRQWGRSAVTGFARLDGWPVAVIASDPMFYGGAWTYDTAQKLTRFIELAESFHLPVVHLVDVPGFLIGLEAERAGTIRQGARALASVYQARTPWCAIILRKAFGVAGASMLNHTRYRFRYAWPSGDWGSLPLEGGLQVAYKAQLAEAEDPAAMLAEIEARLNRSRSPFLTAENFLVEEIIEPRRTRELLCDFANLAAPLRTPGRVAFTLRP